MADLAFLRSARAVRERAAEMLALAEGGRLDHFTVNLAALPALAARVADMTRAAYPDPARIPYHSRWRHFGAGGIDRTGALGAGLADRDARGRLRARFDLVITSVLLDAGAGERWAYHEAGTGVVLGRSEGLALASFHWFMAGGLSGAPAVDPLRADADGLAAVTEGKLAAAFQVSAENPLVGAAGRAALLAHLGAVVHAAPAHFGGDVPRVGNLADHLLDQAAGSGSLPAPAILTAVLEAFGPIWPERSRLHGVNLGDVWPHPKVDWVPFHKLSQWLTYSLLEPLEEAGAVVTDLDQLTGLAEYRNGGLFVDGGVLVPKHPSVLTDVHEVGSPVVVEWRALTVALLDLIAVEVRRRLGCDARTLPLAKVLEGGTWSAGRQLAREKRPGGGPPIRVRSDGTVF